MSSDRLVQLRQRPILSLTGAELSELESAGYRYHGCFDRWIREPGHVDPEAKRQARDATADEWDGFSVPEWAVRNYGHLSRREFTLQLERRKVIDRLVAS